MDKCPKCGHWSLSFNSIQGNVVCFNCKHEQTVNVKEYQEKNDLMPKLLQSLELRYKLAEAVF